MSKVLYISLQWYMIFKQPWPACLSFMKPLPLPAKNRNCHFQSCTLAFTWVRSFSIPSKQQETEGPTGLTEEVRFWLSERDFGALLLVADITFWYFIKLPLGMAETKRFLHQGLFLSDFSSSLSLRSSVCRKSLMLYLELDSRINYYEKDFS